MPQALKRFEMVELSLAANFTGTRLPFPDIPQLRDDTTQDIIICGLRSYTIENMPLSPNGIVTPTTAQLLNMFLVLYIEGEESVRLLPMIELQTIFQAASNGTSQQVFEILETEYLKVDWNKSYIQFGTPPTNNNLLSIMLGVRYKKLAPGMWAQLTAGKPKGW